ncbi:hypothetical protein KJ596_02220 [Patescibacteria group bacterium]|nr:hypothetical protein [Patescibacteria group bacterium]MBU1868191.1 hypothetical protein [Patescibacteria group bacterium]
MFKERYFVVTTLISAIFIQLMLWGVFLNYRVLPPEVPLYYFRPWGEARLAPTQQLWLIPVWSGAIFVFNTFLAWFLYKKEKFLAQLLVFTSIVVSGLGFVFLFRIFSLVTP